MTTKANIVIYQGSSYSTSINIENQNNDSVSLDGYTGRAQIRKHVDSNIHFDFNVNIDANQGIVTLFLSASETLAIPHGRYIYDCILNHDSGTAIKILFGVVEVEGSVTRNE